MPQLGHRGCDGSFHNQRVDSYVVDDYGDLVRATYRGQTWEKRPED